MDGVDADIVKKFEAETARVQAARRIAIEGRMAASGGGPDAEEAAIEKWSAAARRNPADMMLLARLWTLAVNAKAFREVGNLKGAAKCYETMIAVRPDDTEALGEYALVMRGLGMADIADAAERKAAASRAGRIRADSASEAVKPK